MSYLLDVNVLIALAWPSHVHHKVVHHWFRRAAPEGWVTCPMTHCGFVRVSSNPKFIADAVSPREAIALLRQIVARPHHAFWPDDALLTDPDAVPSDLLLGHNQVTDAYLLGLAIRHDGRLATLDQRIAALLPPKSPHKDTLHVIRA
jgi:toxin-antitoxin system PIN domain toxin